VSLQERLREMFSRMVEAKDVSLVDTYFDPDFRLSTNGQEQHLGEFRAGHARVYPPVSYRVEYDEDGWVEAGDRLAGRIWITVRRPDEAATRIEVVLLAEFRDGRLLWLKEVTWPDWSRLSAFDEYSGAG
jgi:hypothetical protein